MFQESLNEVSFAILLHKSYHSYPSSRRACLVVQQLNTGVRILQIYGNLFLKLMRKSRQIHSDFFPKFMRKSRHFWIICILFPFINWVLFLFTFRKVSFQVVQQLLIPNCKNMRGIEFHQTLPQILKKWETFPQQFLAISGKCSALLLP